MDTSTTKSSPATASPSASPSTSTTGRSHQRVSGLSRHQSMIHHTSSPLASVLVPTVIPAFGPKRDSYRGNPYDLLYNASSSQQQPQQQAHHPHLRPHHQLQQHHHHPPSRRRSDPVPTSVLAAVIQSSRRAEASAANAMSIDCSDDDSAADVPIDVVHDDVPDSEDDEDCQPLDFSTKKSHFQMHDRPVAQDHKQQQLQQPPLIPVRPSVITCVPSSSVLRRPVAVAPDDRNGRSNPEPYDDDEPMSPGEPKLMIDDSSPTRLTMRENGRKSGADCSNSLSDTASRLRIQQQHQSQPQAMLSEEAASGDDSEAMDPVTEHFRRSLGREYSELMRSKSSPLSSSLSSPSSCGPLTPPMSSAAKSVLVGHAIASSNNNNNSNGSPAAGASATSGPLVTTFTSVKVDVDDHFAKALGDQWKKLKASSASKPSPSSPSASATTTTSPAAKLV